MGGGEAAPTCREAPDPNPTSSRPLQVAGPYRFICFSFQTQKARIRFLCCLNGLPSLRLGRESIKGDKTENNPYPTPGFTHPRHTSLGSHTAGGSGAWGHRPGTPRTEGVPGQCQVTLWQGPPRREKACQLLPAPRPPPAGSRVCVAHRSGPALWSPRKSWTWGHLFTFSLTWVNPPGHQASCQPFLGSNRPPGLPLDVCFYLISSN